jgi:hypothetical protein
MRGSGAVVKRGSARPARTGHQTEARAAPGQAAVASAATRSQRERRHLAGAAGQALAIRAGQRGLPEPSRNTTAPSRLIHDQPDAPRDCQTSDAPSRTGQREARQAAHSAATTSPNVAATVGETSGAKGTKPPFGSADGSSLTCGQGTPIRSICALAPADSADERSGV